MRTDINSIKAFAPATVANVSCGFDIFGFAVAQPEDEVTLTVRGTPGVCISGIEGDGGKLPLDAEKNTAGVAVLALLKTLNSPAGFDIRLKKNLPLGSGMGSSAASAAAALVGANFLLGEPLARAELLQFAMEAERIACGSAHADNVAPSLLGGFVLIRGYHPLDVVTIPTPKELYCTLIHPHLELRTEDSRSILRSSVPLKSAVEQWGNIAGLVAGLMKSDYGLISRSLKDVIAEPVRSLLIPGFFAIRESAMAAGALGCGISGSGPTIFALSTEHWIAVKTGDAVREQFRQSKLDSEVYVSGINHTGARIVSPPVHV